MVTNIQAVETWTGDERRVSTREIQEWFSIRTAATMSLLLGHLRVRKRCARCPHPHSLTEEQDGVRMSGWRLCDEKKKEKRRVNICLWAQSFSKHLSIPGISLYDTQSLWTRKVCLEFYVCAIYIKPFIRSSVCWARRPLVRQAGRYLIVTGPAVVDLRGFLRTDPRAESLVVLSVGLSVTWCVLLQEPLQFLLRHVGCHIQTRKGPKERYSLPQNTKCTFWGNHFSSCKQRINNR